jgi:hypothetical protein
MTEHPDDRTYGELTNLLREANPLIFDGLTTGVVFNEGLIDLEAERVAALANPPGDPPVSADEFRRAGRREIARLRALGPNPPGFEDWPSGGDA